MQQELQNLTEETVVRRTGQLAVANESLLAEILEHTQAEATLIELSGRLMSAQDDERKRIARELHDTTGQVLAALSMNLNKMRRSSSRENFAKFAECIDLIARASSEIRNLSYLLHPPLMDEFGLHSAVKEYVEGFEKITDFRGVPEIIATERGQIEIQK